MDERYKNVDRQAVCQNCGKSLLGKKVIAVRVGTLRYTAHPHINVSKDTEDYFCYKCIDSVAIRRC